MFRFTLQEINLSGTKVVVRRDNLQLPSLNSIADDLRLCFEFVDGQLSMLANRIIHTRTIAYSFDGRSNMTQQVV